MGTGFHERVRKRKLTAIIIDPSAQVRFSVPFIAIFLFCVFTAFAIAWQIGREIGTSGIEVEIGHAGILFLNQIVDRATSYGVTAMIVLGIFNYFLWLVYSHRIFGPEVSIRRQIDALCKGEYDKRITLRKRDEFKEVADDLNRLAEILASKVKG